MRPLPPTTWQFGDLAQFPAGEDYLGTGLDWEPATLLHAYAAGAFPMPEDDGAIGWWSPDPRGVFLPGELVIARSLRRSLRDYTVTFDTDFDAVLVACGDPRRPDGWINAAVRAAYGRLHALGRAHSVEVWFEGALVGGLYGVELGGLFAGESMFHTRTNASKVALVALAERLAAAPGDRIIDTQWCTDHLRTLGCRELARPQYLERMRRALEADEAF